MGDDAGAALELALQLRAHREVHLGREKEHDHCCVANVCHEEIFVQKPDAIDDVCLTRVLPAFGDAQGIDIDTDAARAELARRGDDDAPVAAPEVVHHVAGVHLGQPQHGVHHLHRRGLVAHVGRAQDRRGHRSLLRAADVRDTARGDDGQKNRTMSCGCSEVTPDPSAFPDHPLTASHDVPFFPGQR